MSHFFELEEIEEYVKCRYDIFYFSEKYLGIELTPNQKSIIDSYQNHNKVVVECPRRRGKTTVNAVWMLWHLIFETNHYICHIGLGRVMSNLALEKIVGLLDALPDFFKTGIVRENNTCIRSRDGSCLRFVSSTHQSPIIGMTYNQFIWEEYTHTEPKKFKEMMDCILPLVDGISDSSIFLVDGYLGRGMYDHILNSKNWHVNRVPIYKGNVSAFLEGVKR